MFTGFLIDYILLYTKEKERDIKGGVSSRKIPFSFWHCKFCSFLSKLGSNLIWVFLPQLFFLLEVSHSSTIWFFPYHTFSFLFRTWNQKVMCHEFDGHIELEESFFLSPSFSFILIWACGHWRLLMFIYIFCCWNFLGALQCLVGDFARYN